MDEPQGNCAEWKNQSQKGTYVMILFIQHSWITKLQRGRTN